MRFIRSSLVLLAVAFAAAGCAFQPAPWVPVAAPAPVRMQPVAPVAAAPGIDTTVYGSVAQTAPSLRLAAAPAEERGLFMSAAAPPAAARDLAPPAPRYVAVPQSRYAPAPPALFAYAPSAARGPYTLDSGDRLRIVVFGQDGLSNSYVVDASGYIAMPLIGTVSARGATTEELSSRIAEKLRQGYVNEPHVAVEIEAYRPFFILGEVTQPGQYPYVADMTVETAVAIAGGFGPRAYRKTVTVTRTVHGAQVRMTVPTSYLLRPGDTVNVQERWF